MTNSAVDIVFEVIQRVFEDPVLRRQLADCEDELLTVSDIIRLTKFSDSTARRMIEDGTIPMWSVPGKNGLRITRKLFRKTIDRLEKEGISKSRRRRV